MRLILTTCCALASVCLAQTPAPPRTRAETIERLRDEKAARLAPEALPKAEEFARRFQDQRVLQRIAAGYKGWRLAAGGLATGSGFALGPAFQKTSASGKSEFAASAQLSTRFWQRYTASLRFPGALNQRLESLLDLTHRRYNSLEYYGPGTGSLRQHRSNYRLVDTSLQGLAIARPKQRLRAGAGAGYLWTETGRGRRDELASTGDLFGEAQAPGIGARTDFLLYGLLGQFDYRDNPLGAKSGGNYVAQWVRFHDQTRSLYGFDRFDLEAQQYFGFFNNLRRIALRARGTFTNPAGSGPGAPFYLRPTVGGSDDLRGYRPYRFNGANSLVLNAEYRWEIFSGMDGALFYDAGKVMPRAGHLALGQMKGAAGFGLRANMRNQTFLRVDVGFSREGFMVWFKFNDVFNSQRLGRGTLQQPY